MSRACLPQGHRLSVQRPFLAAVVLGGLIVPFSAAAAQAPLPPSVRLDTPFVVTQMPAGTDLEGRAPVAGGMLRAPYGDRARLVIVFPDGSTRVLSDGFHSACDPEISFDGKRILLAGKRAAGDPWDIFEMAVDGSSVRQITKGLGDCRYPGYQSTLYTITSSEPWHQITFVVTDASAQNEGGGAPVTSLYSCKPDGTAVRRLTFNLSSDMDPTMMADGRLLFASWRRATLEGGLLGRIGLFTVQVDGMDCSAFLINGGKRVKHMPCVTTGGLAVFVEADQAPWDGAGVLSCVALRRPLHSYRPITNESDGFFHSPAPLPDGRILVSRRPPQGSGTHGVYRLDPLSKRMELVFEDSRYHNIQAKAICARPEPDGRSSVVSEEDPHGKFFCLDVYQSDMKEPGGLPRGTVRTLRVLEGVPLRTGPGGPPAGKPRPAASVIPPLAPRRVLGEVPVKEDGSFNIEVPASTPIELQILDADGMALRRCGWIWAKNHEPRGCIGCHEDGELTPANRLVETVTLPSVLACPPAARRHSADFCRDVMPIVARKCVSCHGEGGSPPRLEAGRAAVAAATPAADASAARVYEVLLAPDEPSRAGPPRGKYVDPGRARTSRLVWHLFGRNTSRPWDGARVRETAKPIPPGQSEPLSAEDKRTFIQWIDMGAPWQAVPERGEALLIQGNAKGNPG